MPRIKVFKTSFGTNSLPTVAPLKALENLLAMAPALAVAGLLLPHVRFGEVCRYLVDAFRNGEVTYDFSLSIIQRVFEELKLNIELS